MRLSAGWTKECRGSENERKERGPGRQSYTRYVRSQINKRMWVIKDGEQERVREARQFYEDWVTGSAN
jgi:hypothetical protein